VGGGNGGGVGVFPPRRALQEAERALLGA
jgi:hypothetical protein